MKFYILLIKYHAEDTKYPHKKLFVSYQSAQDCGLKMQENYTELYRNSFYYDVKTSMSFEIHEVELDI